MLVKLAGAEFGRCVKPGEHLRLVLVVSLASKSNAFEAAKTHLFSLRQVLFACLTMLALRSNWWFGAVRRKATRCLIKCNDPILNPFVVKLR